jgi:RNA recognition motif-containing protein
LPKDITEEEMKDFFQKAGLIRIDPETGEYRIKIYLDENG